MNNDNSFTNNLRQAFPVKSPALSLGEQTGPFVSSAKRGQMPEGYGNQQALIGAGALGTALALMTQTPEILPAILAGTVMVSTKGDGQSPTIMIDREKMTENLNNLSSQKDILLKGGNDIKSTKWLEIPFTKGLKDIINK